MSEKTRDRIRSASRGIGGPERQQRPDGAALAAFDRRSRAALVGAAVVGFAMLLTTICATAEPVQETSSSPPVTPERTSPAIAELAPEIQADLFLVQTDAYIEDEDYAAARDAMGKIVDLQRKHDLELADEFHFKYAQVLYGAESYAEAVESLLRYLELTGRSGTHYRKALELLHESLEAQRDAGRTGPGERFRDCEGCPEMVVVPAGSYLMGSPSAEEGRRDNEGPQHRVTIDEPFAAGVYEVTFEEWDACVDAGGCGGYRPDDGGMGRGRRPVMNVSWHDAQRFVEWLREVTGEPYRLLSEAEWEYAARAGTTTRYHYGRTIALNQANGSVDGEWYAKTLPVGSFDANDFGLHDVHGNVWEYVEDCYNGSYRGAPDDGSAWESGNCPNRVWRGGSWRNDQDALRSANRFEIGPENRLDYIGFRVARSLAP